MYSRFVLEASALFTLGGWGCGESLMNQQLVYIIMANLGSAFVAL